MEIKNFWIALLVVILAITFFPLWQGKFYAVGDMRDVFIPLEHFFRQEMLAFRLPAWNPDIAWGYPTIASAQIGFFYPPSLGLRLLPIWLFLPLLLYGHFVALSIGTYFFFRSIRTSSAAAYLGSLAFTLGSFVIQHLTHLNIIITAAWLPWQLLVTKKIAPHKKITITHIAGLSLVLGLPFLAGQLHIPTIMSLMSAIYFLYLRWQRGRSLVKSASVLLIVSFIALLVSSAQLLPTLELVMESSRGPSGDFNISQANQHSFPLYHLPTLLFPRFYGNDSTYWGARLQIEYGIFIGTIPLILALWSITTGKKRFWFWLLVISFLLALGHLSPFRLLGFEPSLWVFSAPARWLLFTTFALALFAARGFDKLPGQGQSFRRFCYVAAVLVITTVTLTTATLFIVDDANISSLAQGAFWGQLNRPTSYYIDKLHSLTNSARASSASLQSAYTVIPVILITTLPFLVNKKRGSAVILALTTAELVFIAATTNPTIPWSKILTPPDTINTLPLSVVTGQSRFLLIREPGDTGEYFTNPASRADSQKRELLHQQLVPLTHSMFNIPGIEWPASLPLAGHYNLLDQLRDTQNKALTNEPLAEQFNIGAVITPTFTGVDVRQLSPLPRVVSEASTNYQSINPSHKKIIVDSPTDTTLTIRDSYYPGWQAFVDGRKTSITRANGIFQQLPISAGHHSVVLRYAPTLLYTGIIITIASLAFCLSLTYKKLI